jgi:hypothetical protein
LPVGLLISSLLRRQRVPAQSEPAAVHSAQKIFGKGVSCAVSQHGINSASRTYRGFTLVIFYPVRHIRRRKDRRAIKAATMRAGENFVAIPRGMVAGENMVGTRFSPDCERRSQ